jgi:saccharopine dehydrogenase-like NADP-dependent oxidoreductase
MKSLVLGAGAVGTVSALKFQQNPLFERIVIADAVPARARKLADRLDDPRVHAIPLDAGNQGDVVRALRETGSTLLLNAALPATNVTLMRACLEAGCDYMDMASGGTDLDGVPKLDDQFELDEAFRRRGRLALLGIGADPGTTNIYAAHIAKHLLDDVTAFHVRDGDDSECDGAAGFVAAFNPWVFIDECLCRATVFRDGRLAQVEPLTGAEPFEFPELGSLTCYNVDHEETKTLPRFFPELRTADFKIFLSDVTLETLRVLQRMGLGRTGAIQVGGVQVVPRSLVVALLPQPVDLAGKLHGRSCVGTLGRGWKDGEERAYYVYSIADHQEAFAELGVHATAYQTGIPPVIAAELLAEGAWEGVGVMSPEQFDPDPFLERLPDAGMAWEVRREVVRAADVRPRVLEHAPPLQPALQCA